MATLPTKSQGDIVALIASGMQGRAAAFLNFTVGSILRVFAEAYAGVLLWIQNQNLATAKLTRLATSFGTDVDSFIADFPLSGVERFGAVAATGVCTFARYTASGAAVYVPVGGQVKTADGTQAFAVYADTTNPAFDPTYTPAGATAAIGGYRMDPQVSSVTAPVQGITNGTSGAPGANGNVGAGSIALIASNMPGVDTVTNVAALTNGVDVEADASLKTRFQVAVQGRSGGTTAAIQSAVLNIKSGMSCVVLTNQNLDGTFNPGVVSVIVDDGSGAVSGSLLDQARSAVFAVVSAGARPGIYAAVTLPIDVGMELDVVTGYYRPTVVAKVTAALGLYINGLGQGAGVGYFDLPAVAKTIPGCSGVKSATYTLNGGVSDIIGTAQTTPKARALTVS